MVRSILLAILLLLCASNAMRVIRDVKLDSDYGEFINSAFLARFPISEGASFHASARTKLTAQFNPGQNYPFSIYFLTDTEWDQALNENNCQAFQRLARFTLDANLRGDSEWSRWEAYEIQSMANTQIWYAVAADCNGYTHKLYPTMPYIEIELHMLNSGSEYSSEEYGVIPLLIFEFFIYCYFLLSTTYRVIKDANDKDYVENALMGLILAIYMQLLHIILEGLHLYIYFPLFNVLSTVCEMNSQFTIVGMLVMISFGWSITEIDIMQDFKYIVLGAVVLVIHTMASFFTIFDDGAHHKYHDFSGYQGLFIVSLRFCIFIVFIYGITTTIKTVPKNTKRFLKALGTAGTLYILAFPALWIISHIISQHIRNRFIVFGNMLVQLVSIIIFLNQLIKKGSGYQEVSKNKKRVL